nr:hypothetical protein [Klebsiella pneumoniae subsp. pneumoniae]
MDERTIVKMDALRKRFPFVDLLIVTMITYGRLSLSGVVGDHPGETTIRKVGV